MDFFSLKWLNVNLKTGKPPWDYREIFSSECMYSMWRGAPIGFHKQCGHLR